MVEVLWKMSEGELFEFFQSMSDDQAQAFFDEYMRLRRERYAALIRSYLQSGDRNERDLDYSPDSLEPLWDRAARRFRRRAFTPSELEHAMSLPASVQAYNKPPLSEESLILVNDIACYFGEILVRTLEGVHWRICRSKLERYLDRNQPVLGGFTATGFELGINPREWVKGLVLGAVDGETDERALLRTFESCVTLAKGKPE